MKNEIDICKYFFTECCEPTKTLRSNFGKVSIEQSMNTYVSGNSFYQALKELDIPTKGTSYDDCKFALKIKRECENTVLFEPFRLSLDRIIDVENKITEKQIKLCEIWLDAFATPATSYHKYSSYHFKHEVERFFGIYISNDSFIEAAKIFENRPVSKLNFEYKFYLRKQKPTACWIATKPMGKCEMYNKFSEHLFERDGTFYQGAIMATKGMVKNDRILMIENILVNNKNIQKLWD